jgi:perosamine synthetase
MDIYLDAPNLGELEKQYLCRCVDSTFVSTVGPFVPEFERKFADIVGVNHAVSTQSGTAAIHMALYELGIVPGDEIIVPVITFIATVNPIVYMGARPVFVDIDPVTWNIDPVKIEQVITSKTKAIMPVHLYGNPCDMDALMNISKRYGIPIIEDATESLGSTYKGKNTGTFGEYACFSFNGNKVITTGGGGMITTNNEKCANHIKFLVNQARDESKGYFHPEIGFNYRMTNLEASLGLAQLERLNEFLSKKTEFYNFYRDCFDGDLQIELQQETSNAISSWWFTSARIYSNRDIETIQNELKEKGIPTRRIFPPIVDFPPYQKYALDAYPNAYELYKNGLNLPSSTFNSEEAIQFVAHSIRITIRN